MANLYINRDIAPDADKFKYWLSGDNCVSFSDIRDFISWIPAEDNRIDIELHSCGGDCMEGYAIYDALRATGKEISCKVVGVCASMATVILLAAPPERRSMYEHAQLLIHEPFYPSGIAGAITLDKLEEYKTSLSEEKEKMIALYVERTGSGRAAIEKQMQDGDYFGSEQAIKLGFISEVIPAASAAAEKKEISFNVNNMAETKEKKKAETVEAKPTVAEAFRMMGVALGIITPGVKAMVITTSTGEELNVDREEGEIQVGDKASPDGTFVLEDGRTVIVEGGVITEIKEPSSEEDDMDALKDRIATLESEIAELKKNAKSEDEARILAAVDKMGGEKWLSKAAASTYVPDTRSTVVTQTDKKEPVSAIRAELEELRERQRKRWAKN